MLTRSITNKMLKESILLTFLVIVALSSPSQASNVDYLDGRTYVLKPQRWPRWHVVMGSDAHGILHGRKGYLKTDGMFIFEQITKGEPYFYITSKRWPSWYVYMTHRGDGRVESLNNKPGPAGQWRITYDGYVHTFSTRRWPNWYMCMKDDARGTMIGCEDSPRSEGTFVLYTARK